MSYQELLRQNLAAESDYRTTCTDEKWWTDIRDDKALYQNGEYDPEEDTEGTWVRVRFEVCPACHGRGKYVNPSIDAHGLTREDFDNDPDFEESYWRGDYDVVCKLCDGRNVVPVPLDKEIFDEIVKQAEEEYYYRQEVLAEIRMGA